MSDEYARHVQNSHNSHCLCGLYERPAEARARLIDELVEKVKGLEAPRAAVLDGQDFGLVQYGFESALAAVVRLLEGARGASAKVTSPKQP